MSRVVPHVRIGEDLSGGALDHLYADLRRLGAVAEAVGGDDGKGVLAGFSVRRVAEISTVDLRRAPFALPFHGKGAGIAVRIHSLQRPVEGQVSIGLKGLLHSNGGTVGGVADVKRHLYGRLPRSAAGKDRKKLKGCVHIPSDLRHKAQGIQAAGLDRLAGPHIPARQPQRPPRGQRGHHNGAQFFLAGDAGEKILFCKGDELALAVRFGKSRHGGGGLPAPEPGPRRGKSRQQHPAGQEQRRRNGSFPKFLHLQVPPYQKMRRISNLHIVFQWKKAIILAKYRCYFLSEVAK